MKPTQLIAALLLAALAVSPAFAADNKKKEAPATTSAPEPAPAPPAPVVDKGPSAQETVDFLNGLFACEITYYSNGAQLVSYSPTFENYQEQLTWKKSELAINQGNISLVENSADRVNDSEFNKKSYTVSSRHNTLAKTQVISKFKAGELLPDVKVNGKEVVISCNPEFGNCIANENKKGAGNCNIAFKVEELDFCAEVNNNLRNAASSNKQSTSGNLSFCDEDKAQRAAKAMKHLIEISGAKKSLF